MKTVGHFTVSVLTSLWSGFVIHLLWRWFVVRLGVPAISVTQAVGLVITVRLFVGGKPDLVALSKETDRETQTRHLLDFVWGVTAPAIALAAGYVFHLWN